MIVSAWRSSRKGGWISSRLTSRLVVLGGMFLLALVLACTGCREAAAPAPRLEALRFTDDGLELALAAPAPGAALEVETDTGIPVQRLSVQTRDRSPRLWFSWQSGQTYRFTLRDAAGRAAPPLSATAPVRSPLRALLRLPYGQSETRLEPDGQDEPLGTLTTGGAPVQLGLELTNTEDVPLEVEIEPRFDGRLGVDRPLEPSIRLTPAEPSRQVLTTLKVPAGEGEYPVAVRVRYRVVGEGTSPLVSSGSPLAGSGGAGDGWHTLSGRAVLLARAPETVRTLIRAEDYTFPTDARGVPDLQRLSDTVALPNPLWRALGTLFQARALSFDPYAPYAYETVTFRNTTPYPLTLLVTARTLDPSTGTEPAAFVPRAFEVTGGTGRLTTLARIPANGSGTAIVPFYVQKDAADGVYTNELEVKLLGSDAVIHRLTRPLQVVRSDARVNLTLLVVIPFSLLSAGFFGLRYRRLITTLDARALTTISLFGTLMFTVTFFIDLLSVGLNVVLGPFNLLVVGVLYEILHHLVLATLLVLYPRPGTAALVGLVHYLMRGLTTGQVSPVDVLFVGSSLGFKELALYGLGVTRGAALLPRLQARPRGTRLRVVLALALASGATGFTSLALHTAFYRLFFAGWYVWMNLAVAVVGAWAGALMGLRFGLGLNRVRD